MINAAGKRNEEFLAAERKRGGDKPSSAARPLWLFISDPSISLAAGNGEKNRRRKTPSGSGMLAASSILKKCCTYGIKTSFKDVSEPHIKKMW